MNYWPQVLFDTREGLQRDADPANVANGMPYGGMMYYVSLDARNLALWTNWGGIDPESNGGLTNAFVAGVYSDIGAPPQSRYWLLRLDLGL